MFFLYSSVLNLVAKTINQILAVQFFYQVQANMFQVQFSSSRISEK